MKTKIFLPTVSVFLGLIVLALAAPSTLAQEGELKVVDEVIAQVNEDVSSQ